jgi:dolichol-phosphate mannosyltransferase
LDSQLLLSLIIPVYNEEEVLPETLKRLEKFALDLKNLKNINCEFIFIDDGSADQTKKIITQASLENSQIKLITLSRNFGHEFATTAGLDHATGDLVVLIDADLQDPPEVIFQMIEKWQEGYEVVYGQRTKRLGEAPAKIFFAKVFYRVLNYFSEISIPLDTGDFRLMSRQVVDALKRMPERDRLLRGMIAWLGFAQIALPYERHARFAGETKYPFRKSLKLKRKIIIVFIKKITLR